MPNVSSFVVQLLEGGLYDQAIKELDRLLVADPQNWEHHVNIGIAYRLKNRFDLALLHQTLATQLKPEMAAAWHNLGITRTELGDFEGAFLAHQQAYKCEPDSQQVCLGYAYALMRYGKFELAWPLWEKARYHTSFWEVPKLPLWTGVESLEGKKILVFMEGGYGDAIMFLRWMAQLQDLGAETTLQAYDNQASLFVGHPWVNNVVTNEEPINPKRFDYCASIMSLPALLNCSAERIPSAEHYIMAHPDNVRLMRGKIHRNNKPLVGICWGAEEAVVPKRSRTIPNSEVEPLRESPVDWISLWPGHKAPWMSEIELKDWQETAALITHLDAVVSVDTAVLHLAAAMGKHTVGMVPIGSDWKFFRGVSPSPWYSHLEVITNDSPVSWKGAVEKTLGVVSGLHRFFDGVDSKHGNRPSEPARQ